MSADKIKDGGFAFPLPAGADVNLRRGMTLRDWFAGQALIALAGKHYTLDEPSQRVVATRAYEIADAMLLERLRHGGDE